MAVRLSSPVNIMILNQIFHPYHSYLAISLPVIDRSRCFRGKSQQTESFIRSLIHQRKDPVFFPFIVHRPNNFLCAFEE